MRQRDRIESAGLVATIAFTALAAASLWIARSSSVQTPVERPRISQATDDQTLRPQFAPPDAPIIVDSRTLRPATPHAELTLRRPRTSRVTTRPVPVVRAQASVEVAHTTPSASVPLPLARDALAAVGSDPIAEGVWLAAINDPSMPPRDRSDLIEDLNESGFADPENVSSDELPIVLSRLELIEQVAPEAMDDTNAAAFAEAHKDLSDLAERLAR
jgi:hypothetical protein